METSMTASSAGSVVMGATPTAPGGSTTPVPPPAAAAAGQGGANNGTTTPAVTHPGRRATVRIPERQVTTARHFYTLGVHCCRLVSLIL